MQYFMSSEIQVCSAPKPRIGRDAARAVRRKVLATKGGRTMLTISGTGSFGCDGLPRRRFLKLGALGLTGGLLLPDLLRAEAKAGRASTKSLINIWLQGGPSHQDLWDLKPEAPSEIRGEFRPIPTNVAGIEICELLPRLAKMADRYAIIRGLVGSIREHTYDTVMTGFPNTSLKSVGGRPAIGSVISKIHHANGSERDKALPYVSFMGPVTTGYLGPVHSPFVPDADGLGNLSLGKIDADRLKSRVQLLTSLDTLRRDTDQSGRFGAMDEFTRRAVDVVTSGTMGDALDLSKEAPETIQRYCAASPGKLLEESRNLLRARRLVEAGVRCVALSWGDWDTHGDNFSHLRKLLPALDLGLSALLGDLSDRGMLRDVTVVLWGEFGRTPRINPNAGRDHWEAVSSALVAGGGLRMGQVVGQSDRLAGEAIVPVHVHQLHATLYRAMGIDLETTQFVDPSGRPQYLLDQRDPIRELV